MPIVIRMPSIREWEEREGVECTRFYRKYVGPTNICNTEESNL